MSIAVTVMLMIKSRNWLPGRCGSRLLAAGAAQRQPDGRVARVVT